MITLKQIEALYWVARLGGFEAAADYLNTTQSAVSKRIQDLEARYGQALLDRTRRSSQLTPLGEEVVELTTKLLGQRDAIVQQLERPETLKRKLRLGVTELTALTWLPIMVSAMRERYPQVEIIPEVDLSPSLLERLSANTIDLIIIPDIFPDNRFESELLSDVENAWMGSPALLGDKTIQTLEELADLPLIVQGTTSGMGMAYGQWFKQLGLHINKPIICSNLLAQIGLAVSGLGVSYLPLHYLSALLDSGTLIRLDVQPLLPRVKYRALHRNDANDLFMQDLLAIAKRTCDFGSYVTQPQPVIMSRT